MFQQPILAKCIRFYFLILLIWEIVYVITLEFFKAKACKLKIKSYEFDLSLELDTFGSSLSMILIASPKLD
jgi:hypothetical protein